MATDTLTPALPRTDPSASGRTTSMRRQKRLGATAILVFLILSSLLMAAPFLWMALSSIRDPTELAQVPMPLIPQDLRLENYTDALARAPFATYARNSLILATAAAVLNVAFGSACGYALAKLRFRLASAVFGWMVA